MTCLYHFYILWKPKKLSEAFARRPKDQPEALEDEKEALEEKRGREGSISSSEGRKEDAEPARQVSSELRKEAEAFPTPWLRQHLMTLQSVLLLVLHMCFFCCELIVERTKSVIERNRRSNTERNKSNLECSCETQS